MDTGPARLCKGLNGWPWGEEFEWGGIAGKDKVTPHSMDLPSAHQHVIFQPNQSKAAHRRRLLGRHCGTARVNTTLTCAVAVVYVKIQNGHTLDAYSAQHSIAQRSTAWGYGRKFGVSPTPPALQQPNHQPATSHSSCSQAHPACPHICINVHAHTRPTNHEHSLCHAPQVLLPKTHPRGGRHSWHRPPQSPHC